MDTSMTCRRACAAAAAVLIAFGAAACGGDDGADDDPTDADTSAEQVPTATPSETAAAAGAVAIATAADPELGEHLVDNAGMVLYLFTADTENTSTCHDECAVMWPPLLTDTAEVAASGGADPALVGTIERTEGILQVTYKGHPLYYYADDEEPGETDGQGVDDVWFVVNPDGTANKKED